MATNKYALGYIDPSQLGPSAFNYDYAHGGVKDKPNAYALLSGSQLGLDNNYKYAVYPDGHIEHAYQGNDATYDPNTSSTAADPSKMDQTRSASELAAQGWDYAKASKDAHGVPMPGTFGGVAYNPMGDQKSNNNFLFDTLGPTAAFGLLAGGVGAAGLGAAGGTAAGTDLGGGLAVDAYGNVAGGSMGLSGGAAGASGSAAAGGTTLGTGGAASGAGGSMDLMDLGGGLGLDEFGNVTGGLFQGGPGTAGAGDFFGSGGGNWYDSLVSGGQNTLSGLNAYRGILGPLAGAAIGGLAGGSRPAGTTTTVQDVPDWLKPYVMQNLNSAGGARDALLAGPNVTSAATPEYMKTMNGDYLNPASNPWLDATYQHAANLMGANVDSRFEASGRYGSGAHQGVLQEGLNNLGTSIYGGNYQAERARQNAAVTGAPEFSTNSATAAYAPYKGYASLFPNVSSTTAPYFNNPGAGILGGALAGGAVSRMWG